MIGRFGRFTGRRNGVGEAPYVSAPATTGRQTAQEPDGGKRKHKEGRKGEK